MSAVEAACLGDGTGISRIIKGGWQLAGGHGSVDRTAAISDMEAYLDSGISTFDCADIYTGVEEMIGEFIADIRTRRGTSTAEKITVHTKLVPDLDRLSDLQDFEVEAIIDRSLKRLKIDRLHLVQFFWWDLSIGDAVAALDVLKDCQKKGKIANLGVNNWDSTGIARFVEAGYDISSAQVQYSVLDRRPANGLDIWAAENGIQFLCYGTLAGGFLTENWLGKPDPGFDFVNRSLIKYRLIIDEFGPWDLFQMLLNLLAEIGEKHRVSLSSVATRWVLNQPQVAAAIVGSRYASHLPKTLEVFQFQLDDEDHSRIAALQEQSTGPDGPVYGLESDRSSRHGRIMKYNLNNRTDEKILGQANG